MLKHRIYLIAWAAVLAFFSLGVFAQVPSIDSINQKANRRPPKKDQPKPEVAAEEVTESDDEVLKIDTGIVTTTVKAMNRKGKFITGLSKDDFSVFDNGVEQEIAFFSNEQQPFTVALVLDMSYSATFKIGEIQSAAVEFINQLKPNDRVMVVSFDSAVTVLSEPTSDRKELTAAIQRARLGSGTSLYDAIDLVLNERLSRIDGRKAVVLFSDGVDTTSTKTLRQTNLQDAIEFDAVIFPIRYDTFRDVQRIKNDPILISQAPPVTLPGKYPQPVPMGGASDDRGTTVEDYQIAEEYLQSLADSTNGKLYLAQSTSNLAGAFGAIAYELRSYYSLGFYPKEKGKAGDRHKLKVRAKRDGIAIRARESYVVR